MKDNDVLSDCCIIVDNDNNIIQCCNCTDSKVNEISYIIK